MMDRFEKMLAKKGKKVSPVEQAAKSDVLDGLRNKAADQMGEKLGGLKKVEVAAPDKSSLEQGLDKAKELLGHMSEDDGAGEGLEGSPEEEGQESPEEEMQEMREEHKDCTPEEMQQKIDMLTQLKDEKSGQKQGY